MRAASCAAWPDPAVPTRVVGGVPGWGEAGEGGGLALGPAVGGGEVAVGEFLGQRAGFAEHEGHVGPADLELGESVGDHGGADPVEFEDPGVAVLDHQGGAG